MTPSKFNAFLRNTSGGQGSSAKSLAGLLATMRARMTRNPLGRRLELEPIRAIDAVRPWIEILPDPNAHTLLCHTPCTDEPESIPSISALLERLGIEAVEVFDEHLVVVNNAALAELATMSRLDDISAILIEGPIEEGDAEAIREAIEAGISPLEVELRAAAVMRIVHDRAAAIESRDRRAAMIFIAENMRNYLAAVRNRPPEDIAAPDLGLVDSLLSRTGRISVRPIETDVYGSSIDIGVSTTSNGAIRPADGSLIYDIVSNTWHGE